MEGKKNQKVALLTVLLILAVIVIFVMAYYMYTNNTNSKKEIEDLKTNTINMQNTINTLQEEIINAVSNAENNTVSNNTSSRNETVANNTVSFTENQVKTALANYLELRANAGCDNLLETLTKKGDLNYDSSKDIAQNDGIMTTNIKFSDYKKVMLNYVTEAEFERNWNSTQYFDENKDGYLTKVQGGGAACNVYTIESITKNTDLNYTAKTTYIIDETEPTPKYDKNFTFTIKSYDNNCVIDSVE